MWVSAAGVRPPGRGEKGGEKGPGTSSGLALGLSRGGGGAAVEVGGQERVGLEGGVPSCLLQGLPRMGQRITLSFLATCQGLSQRRLVGTGAGEQKMRSRGWIQR